MLLCLNRMSGNQVNEDHLLAAKLSTQSTPLQPSVAAPSALSLTAAPPATSFAAVPSAVPPATSCAVATSATSSTAGCLATSLAASTPSKPSPNDPSYSTTIRQRIAEFTYQPTSTLAAAAAAGLTTPAASATVTTAVKGSSATSRASSETITVPLKLLPRSGEKPAQTLSFPCVVQRGHGFGHGRMAKNSSKPFAIDLAG